MLVIGFVVGARLKRIKLLETFFRIVRLVRQNAHMVRPLAERFSVALIARSQQNFHLNLQQIHVNFEVFEAIMLIFLTICCELICVIIEGIS